MGISRCIKSHETIYEPTVNQRVLGSSPRGGGDKPSKALFLLGFLF